MDPSSQHEPDGVASVLEEIRQAQGERSSSGSRILRVLGLAVLGIAIWVIARNVTWVDTLVLERGGQRATIKGVIEGDWRGDAVKFTVATEGDQGPQGAEAALLRIGGTPGAADAFSESIATGRALELTDREVRLFGGAALARTGDGAMLAVDRIEWRPGMGRTLREIDPAALAPALLFLVLASLCVTTRWWRLLALNHCPTRWYDAFRFTYSGLFFNAVIPGINGGDVARAVAVVRGHPDRRGDAFMTVVVDRVLGLVGMVVLGTVLVLLADDRLAPLKLPVGLFCGALLLGAALFFAPPVRRLVRFEEVARRLPQGERLLRLDAGARRLLRAPGEVAIALALSFGNHVLNGMAVFAAARALGSDLGFADWLATMAIGNTVAALPLSPGGLGVGEVLFGSLAELLGSTYAIGVATSLLYRLALYAMSLLGGLVMLLPRGAAIESPPPVPGGDAI